MDALFIAGIAEDHAIALMTAPGDRSWRHIVEDVGTTITLEAWDQKCKPNQDWNHAWGAAPANIIPRMLLGVGPVAPGWSHLRIYPRLGKLRWAEGRIPTPHGPVTVRAESGDEYRLDVTVPVGTTASVIIPARSSQAVTESGKPLTASGPVKSRSKDGQSAEVDVPAGSFKFSAK